MRNSQNAIARQLPPAQTQYTGNQVAKLLVCGTAEISWAKRAPSSYIPAESAHTGQNDCAMESNYYPSLQRQLTFNCIFSSVFALRYAVHFCERCPRRLSPSTCPRHIPDQLFLAFGFLQLDPQADHGKHCIRGLCIMKYVCPL